VFSQRRVRQHQWPRRARLRVGAIDGHSPASSRLSSFRPLSNSRLCCRRRDNQTKPYWQRARSQIRNSGESFIASSRAPSVAACYSSLAPCDRARRQDARETGGLDENYVIARSVFLAHTHRRRSGRARRLCPVLQTSIFSAISIASSISHRGSGRCSRRRVAGARPDHPETRSESDFCYRKIDRTPGARRMNRRTLRRQAAPR